MSLDPELKDALFNLGYLYATTGMLADSEEMLKRVVSLKPPYLDKALFNLAVVQQRQGNTKESIRTLERALAIGAENERIVFYLNQLRRGSLQ